jgi:predicted MPP superfamily phosphohydrolase
MQSYAWCTDIHLDHLTQPALMKYAQSLKDSRVDGLFLTGDISNSNKLLEHLGFIEAAFRRPIYYVLGNHDYYGGNIFEVRRQVHAVNSVSEHLRWLNDLSYIPLTASTAVVGHDGWYDALYGDAPGSPVVLNDWRHIGEFYRATEGNLTRKDRIIDESRKLAHEAVTHLHNGIKGAVRYHNNIIILTHVPPFAEAHIYNNRQGDKDYLPWFTSKMCGDMLRSAAKAFPKARFTVLSGHTHGAYRGTPFEPNLEVMVGGAEYGQPRILDVLQVM